MLKAFQERPKAQLVIALFLGIGFGFFLQKGGVTRYDVILGQLLLYDWTVAKIMLTVVAVGSLGVYFLRALGLVELSPIEGSVGSSMVGGLIFGVGFALLGYCPGTNAGAVGQGSLDALVGGVPGIMLGAWLYSFVYPKLKDTIQAKGYFDSFSVPQLFELNPWTIIVPLCVFIAGFMFLLEKAGL